MWTVPGACGVHTGPGQSLRGLLHSTGRGGGAKPGNESCFQKESCGVTWKVASQKEEPSFHKFQEISGWPTGN